MADLKAVVSNQTTRKCSRLVGGSATTAISKKGVALVVDNRHSTRISKKNVRMAQDLAIWPVLNADVRGALVLRQVFVLCFLE